MSEYSLNVNGQLQLGDFCDIQDYMNIVDFQDKLTVILNSVDDEEIEMIKIMLKNKNFNISDTFTDKYGKVNIKAYKNS